MRTLEQLYNGFYLNREDANSQISSCKTPLRVAPIKKVDKYEDLEIDYKHFAFAEGDDYYHGLTKFLRIERGILPPIFIFDNHNHAITFRYSVIYNKKLNNIELIHIDQHSDCRENKNHLKLNQNKNELEKVFKFGNEKCNVGNFIPPTIESGIIKTQIQIRSIDALKNLKINKNQNYLLDIDLDFCLNGINRNIINQETVEILKKKFEEIEKYTSGITIATSPYFINQNNATAIIKYLLNK